MNDRNYKRVRNASNNELEAEETKKEAARIEQEKLFKAASQEKQKGILEQLREANAYLNPKDGEVIETHMGEDGKEYDQFGNVVVRNSLGQIIPQELFDQIEASIAEKTDDLEDNIKRGTDDEPEAEDAYDAYRRAVGDDFEDVYDDLDGRNDDDGFEEAKIDDEPSEEKEKRKGKIGKVATVGILSVLIALGAQGIYEFTNEDSFVMKNLIHKYGIEERVPESANVQIEDPDDLLNHAIIINEPTQTPEGEKIEVSTVDEEAPTVLAGDKTTEETGSEVSPAPDATEPPVFLNNEEDSKAETTPVVSDAATTIQDEAPTGTNVVSTSPASTDTGTVVEVDAPLVNDVTATVDVEAPVVGNAATIIDSEAPTGHKPVQVADAALEVDEEAPLVKGEGDER